MQKHYTYSAKAEGDPLTHTEWNNLAQDVDAAVEAINQGASGVVSVTDETESGGDPTVGVSIASGVQQVGSPKVIELTKKKKGVNTTITSENNINIEPRESVNTTKGGNISFKPGDDIEFCSHHRLAENQDEVSIKIIDGDDNPVKLQLNAAEMTLTTKDKTGNDANVFDINVNSGKNTKGYLKVRAQAIDLRCEEHGGIALQPKGTDGQGNENKIKFEHGGGDGLEFGTFNTEKTSIFTNEYRFNKKGDIYLSTRTKVLSDKVDALDGTTTYKYVKANDDFYDNIDLNDPTCTWQDILTFIAWAKDNAEGPFTLDYLVNSQLPSDGYVLLTDSMIGNNISNFVDSITGLTVEHEGTNVQLTRDRSYPSSPTQNGQMAMYELYFKNSSDSSQQSSILAFSYASGKIKIIPYLDGGYYDQDNVMSIAISSTTP